jgi:hypothetical protein
MLAVLEGGQWQGRPAPTPPAPPPAEVRALAASPAGRTALARLWEAGCAPLRRLLAALRLRWRVRAMKRRDPFIY